MIVSNRLAEIAAPFRDLDLRDLSTWQPIPCAVLSLAAGVMFFALGWVLLLGDSMGQLDQQRAAHETLRQSFSTKIAQVANLQQLRLQKQEISSRVSAAEQQLPDKTEMEALLADINHAGLSRGLHFELFKPEAPRIEGSLAEIPIQIKVNGRYEDLAGFSTDLATMSRIVSLRDLKLSLDKQNGIAMEAEVVAYRTLDAAERAASKAAAASNGNRTRERS